MYLENIRKIIDNYQENARKISEQYWKHFRKTPGKYHMDIIKRQENIRKYMNQSQDSTVK